MEVDFVLMHEVGHIVLQHCLRSEGYEHERYNIAADIVVNSNILLENNLDTSTITLRKYGEAIHLIPPGAPRGKEEGYNWTAEEVYAMLPPMLNVFGGSSEESETAPHLEPNGFTGTDFPGRWDDHTHWDEFADDEALRDEWKKRIENACEVISIREASKSFGGSSLLAKRLLGQMHSSQIDWRMILQDFVQKEVNDYSFTPPDRRFSDSPFFLPNFNDDSNGEKVDGIWFVVDTSGSIGDKAINAAYAEICSAIDIYDGNLTGYLSFTECYVTDPIEFSSIDDLMAIKPIGGGGNDFAEIFRYLKKNLMDSPPECIVIITDGYDNFPKEEVALGIPVLWLINNDDAVPPWGKVARIEV